MQEISKLRVRISQQDVHYGGGLLSGSQLLEFFGDVATELLIRHDGDEGLFRAYDSVEFLAPVFAGDYLEIEGKITHVGNTSRKMEFTAKKVITPEPTVSPSAARLLKEPVLVAKASGTCVVPKELQRKKQ
ncbi:MAG: 3-aminobutyryl-CoA ammonia lyase [Proteobacteria bacterium]|nr:3-aminobutyryl-CoA ammonia lyase [Pseudomonadota bacterium]NDC25416.1 3-aminobutyryl-CoA ammonia lyase [Pseudomonadota bacterium]NDD05201.1 3-aminobutyryl-CoA ammonia lyase [Pseudomonadota bacterium]NDG25902.1 3-aminobutyryl-CoA ammonia lyase [Pseudomonadota bacterium]